MQSTIADLCRQGMARAQRALRARVHWATAAIAAMALALTASCAAPATNSVPTVKPSIIRTLPHDTLAFTQGLIYHQGRLYESTGAPPGHRSSLRVIDATSGSLLSSRAVPGVFAEGFAAMGATAIQLTWRDQIAFVYTFPSLTLTRTATVPGEGWGLTSDGKSWIVSTGSDTLLVRDHSFAITRRIPVTYRGNPLSSLNELEYARGRIYANVWHSDDIFEIDPRSGRVLRVVDCSDLVARAAPPTSEGVLNGIAYNSESGTFFLTGKDWRVIFEVSIP